MDDTPAPASGLNGLWRALLIILLSMGLAGFGLCSLCGGLTALSSLGESRASMQELVGVGLGFFFVAGLLAWGCWRGLRALSRRRPRP